MDSLPDDLVVQILNRLSSSSSLLAIRGVSTRLRSLSLFITTLTISTFGVPPTPSKSTITNLLLLFPPGQLRSLSLQYDNWRHFRHVAGKRLDERDAWLTDDEFVGSWLGSVGKGLRELVIWDRNRDEEFELVSNILALISDSCENLVSLELESDLLSTEGLKPLPKLTKLRLECKQFDDEDLDIVTTCFPSVKVLDLHVEGVENPKIHLQNLKYLYWTFRDSPCSLTICAPHLVLLSLGSRDFKSLTLKTPALSRLVIDVDWIEFLDSERFLQLGSLNVSTSSLWNLVNLLRASSTSKCLVINWRRRMAGSRNLSETFGFRELSELFPEATDMTLRHDTWYEFEKSFAQTNPDVDSEWRSLKKLTVHLQEPELNHTFISYVLEMCPLLCEVMIVFWSRRSDTTGDARATFMSEIAGRFAKIKWSFRWMTRSGWHSCSA